VISARAFAQPDGGLMPEHDGRRAFCRARPGL
jgi:hypothetical protein